MKKKGIQKSLRVLCMLLCFFAMTAVRVSAEEAHGQGQKGSLSVVMQNRKTNTKIPGGEVALYQVAGITSKETEIQYAFTNGFENCGLKLDNRSRRDGRLFRSGRRDLSDCTDKSGKRV